MIGEGRMTLRKSVPVWPDRQPPARGGV